MTTKDAWKLKPGEKVFHKWLGDCEVKEVLPADNSGGSVALFGVVIIPVTKEGLIKLNRASGMPYDTPFLASDYKQNLKHILRGSKTNADG